MCWMLNDGRLSSLTKTPSHKQIFTKKTKKKTKMIKHVLHKVAQHLKVTETIINLNILQFIMLSDHLAYLVSDCLLLDVYFSIWLHCGSRVLCLSLGSSAPGFCYTDCTSSWIIIPFVQCVVPWPLYISSFILLLSQQNTTGTFTCIAFGIQTPSTSTLVRLQRYANAVSTSWTISLHCIAYNLIYLIGQLSAHPMLDVLQ